MLLFPHSYQKKIDEKNSIIFNPITMDAIYYNSTICDDELCKLIAGLNKKKKYIVEDDFNYEKYIEDILNKQDYPKIDIKTLKMFTTTNCNLDCQYCLIEKNAITRNLKKSNLTYEIGRKIINKFSQISQLQEASPKTIMLYGGEPLINWENVKKIICYIRDCEEQGQFKGPVEIILETNGTLVTDEIASFLHASNVFIIVSLDGQESVHNLYRRDSSKQGSWGNASRGFEILKNNECVVVISAVFTDMFAQNVNSCIDNLIDKFNPASIGLNLFHLLDNQNIENDKTEHNIDKYIEAYEIARRRGLYIEHIMRRIRPLVDKKIRIKDCGACGNRIVSDCEGRIGICEGFVGNNQYFIDRPEIDEVKKDEIFVAWAKRTPLKMPECVDCCAKGICGAGCVNNAYLQFGDIYKPDTYICRSSIAFVNWALFAWYTDNNIDKKLQQKKVHILTEKERHSILGSISIDNQIPLQNISKQYEV